MALLQKVPGDLQEFSLSDEILESSGNDLSKRRCLYFNSRGLGCTFCQAASHLLRSLIRPFQVRGSWLQGSAASPGGGSIHSKCCPWCSRGGNASNSSFSSSGFARETLGNVPSPGYRCHVWIGLLSVVLNADSS